ncbi:MAG TPA: serine hydrolase domain-containing protein [Longimicrobium sp.]|nr:serine hydrolase domain-containing protein [Longimicrobium sp.]
MIQPCRAAALVAAHAALLGCAAPARHAGSAEAPASAPLAPADGALVAAVDSFTRARASMDSLSGVVLLARDGVPIYTFAAGVADRALGTRNTTSTRFNLASLDKYFTRIAIWQLASAGRLSRSDTVGKHLPDYPNERVRREVTIQHLLGMTSGLGDFGSDNYRTYVARRLTLRSLDDYLALFAADSLEFAPGTRQRYSNAGYVVLGKIVERVSGRSYHDYVREHVFSPAGMVSTGYFAVDERVPEMAVPYTTSAAAAGDFSEDAAPLPERRPATGLLAYRGSSAGGGYSTADDLLRLSRAIQSHRLLDAAFTDSLLGWRNTGPGEFDWSGWAGGAEGINTAFYMHSTGHTLIVLSNYDPPSASVYRGRLWSEWLPAWLRAAPSAR